MRRRTQYRSRRGRRREYRYTGGRPGGMTRWAVIALLVLAGLIVIASILQ